MEQVFCLNEDKIKQLDFANEKVLIKSLKNKNQL